VESNRFTNFYIADVFGPARPGALEQAGIPLRRTINEGNHRVWKYPLDPDGLWERRSRPIPHRTPIMPLGSRAIQYGKRRATTTSSHWSKSTQLGIGRRRFFQGRTSLPAQGSTR